MTAWPCDRRDTHGPHTIEVDVVHDVFGIRTVDEHCPGVRAHPDTMISRPPGESPALR